MMNFKKWKYYLIGCALFTACKSTDCGCPMAKDEQQKKEILQQDKTFHVVKVTDKNITFQQ